MPAVYILSDLECLALNEAIHITGIMDTWWTQDNQGAVVIAGYKTCRNGGRVALYVKESTVK